MLLAPLLPVLDRPVAGALRELLHRAAPEGPAIQPPSFRDGGIGLERATAGKAEARLENVLPVLRGCFTSASAQWGVDGSAEGLSKFGGYLHSWELATERSVDGEIARRWQRKEWGL